MSHTVTAKLNKAARRFDNQAGSTFFVSLGEKNFDYKTKANVWTNYDCALFAKDAQVGFYEQALIEGAIVSVSGSGITIDNSNPEYPAKLVMQDAKLEFISSGQQSAPQQQSQQRPPQQQQSQQAPMAEPKFDDDVPF